MRGDDGSRSISEEMVYGDVPKCRMMVSKLPALLDACRTRTSLSSPPLSPAPSFFPSLSFSLFIALSISPSVYHLLHHSKGDVMARTQALPLPLGHREEVLHRQPRGIKLDRVGLWEK